MRKNTREVFDAWMNGIANCGQDSIWTDGERIFSYQTILVERTPRGPVVNVTKYSQTTSTHQNAIRAAFNARNILPVDFIDNVSRGCKVLT